MIKGVVKEYDRLKGFGFITGQNGEDYFVHVISTIGKPTEGVDDKIIRNICKETYVKE